MRFTKQIISAQSIVLFILIAFSSETARAKSVYAIIYHQNDIIGAYKIDANQIEYQAEIQAPQHEIRAIDLAIDSGSFCIFVTYEWENIIEIINAKTLEYEGSVTATGASNLAGIVFDEAKQKLYTVDRGTDKLFVYFWNSANKTLTPDGYNPKILAELPTPPDAHGIALDTTNNHLYVANRTNIVHYYDTNSWNHVNDVNVGEIAVDVDIDSERGYLYAGGYTYHNYLLKLDLSTGIAEANDIGAGVIGLAVDPNSGLVYTTTFHDQLRVYDTSTSPFTLTDYEDIIKGCGVCVPIADVSYKPPAFYFEKVDVNEPNCVTPGDYITYKITYGPNGVDHNNVVIIDNLPCQVDYINPFDPNYDDANRTYKWQIGSLSASAPNDFVTLTVCVNLGVGPNGIITNYCEIESDQYFSSASADTSACFWSPDIIYVDVNVVGCGSGLSWEHADPDLQSAFQKAQAWDVNQIWVAVGTYKPTTTSARSISFELLDGVAVYGGFAGTESHPNQRDLTDPNNETILSGDIGTPDYKYDNSYHVVKCVDVNNTVLDGFTITAGNANADYPDEPNQCGGGIFCMDSNNLIVRKCISTKNSALNYGGGLFNASSNTNVINCIFIDNTVDDYGGGGICICYEPNPIVANCVFSGNRSYRIAGGLYNYQSSPTIINCSFSNNSAIEGGAVYNNYYSEPNIINCFFNGNTADKYGGGMVNSNESSPAIINCIFSGNSATTPSGYTYGGAICNWNCSDPNITNCTFSNNSAWDGGAVYNYYSEPNITYCIFTGNTADHYGGGIYNYYESHASAVNSIFSGNTSNRGGAINNDNSDVSVTNCTLIGNAAWFGGGMHNSTFSDVIVTNSILWANVVDEIRSDSNTCHLSVTYSDVMGDWTGTGNIDEDPCFFEVDTPTGSWTADASYDSSTFQSTLTNTGASWTVNQLAGKFINPDTSQALHFFIVSNDVNTINVWSNVESIVISDDPYQIYDYHLKVESVCIDAGYPQGNYYGWKDIDGEPRVFDGDYNDTEIVDMGADEYY